MYTTVPSMQFSVSFLCTQINEVKHLNFYILKIKYKVSLGNDTLPFLKRKLLFNIAEKLLNITTSGIVGKEFFSYNFDEKFLFFAEAGFEPATLGL